MSACAPRFRMRRIAIWGPFHLCTAGGCSLDAALTERATRSMRGWRGFVRFTRCTKGDPCLSRSATEGADWFGFVACARAFPDAFRAKISRKNSTPYARTNPNSRVRDLVAAPSALART